MKIKRGKDKNRKHPSDIRSLKEDEIGVFGIALKGALLKKERAAQHQTTEVSGQKPVLRKNVKPEKTRSVAASPTHINAHIIHKSNTPKRKLYFTTRSSEDGVADIKTINKKSKENWKKVLAASKITLQTDIQRLNNKTYSKSISSKLSEASSWQVCKGNSQENRDIVIGFDFGTSCTKVVLQDSQRKESIAVPFDGVSSQSNRYLFPTKIYINTDGSIRLDSGETEIDGLKVRLIQNPSGTLFEDAGSGVVATAFDLAVAYIGLVLLLIRNWFLQIRSDVYRDIHLNWQLNIGMSSRSYDDKPLLNSMKMASLAGWNLSLMNKNPIFLSDVKSAIKITALQIKQNDYSEEKEQLHPDYVNPIPEIIAEVIGYVRSPMRQNGMYLMVDVGASTLDISTFIIYENEDEDQYSILVAEVETLGAFILHQYRIETCKKIVEQKLSKLLSACDGIAPLPGTKDYLPEPTDDDKAIFGEAEAKFQDECSKMIRKVIKTTKDLRNPVSSEWTDGFPYFLCGGGAEINVYKRLFEDIEKKLENSKYKLSLIKKGLPIPRDFKNTDISERNFNRIAVAYGLSFPKYDIGNITPPDKIEDLVVNQKIRELTPYYIDKDMM